MAVLFVPGEDATRVYYGTDTRGCALIFGAMLGMVYTNEKIMGAVSRGLHKIAPVLLVLFTALVLVSFVVMDGQGTLTYRGGMQLITLIFGFIVLIVADDSHPFGEWLDLHRSDGSVSEAMRCIFGCIR